MTDKFILVSLEDKKAKLLAEVLSNNTSRKILDFLSEKEATSSEISKKLGIALSTVEYNLDNLVNTGLVEAREFRWSPKGKQMDIFRVKKKYIVISPEKEFSLFKENLKKILPIGIIGLGIGAFIQLKNRVVDSSLKAAAPVAERSASLATEENMVSDVIQQANNLGIYFILGVLFVIVLFLLFSWRKE